MPFIDTNINNRFKLVRRAGNGAIGTVYYAKRINGIEEDLAIKLVPRRDLRDGWEKEINKILVLGNGQKGYNVPSYRDHGFVTIDDTEYLWIATSWINGTTAKDLIEEKKITIPIIISIIRSCLIVLHGCKTMAIQHGDLHAGNIMVEPPGDLSIEKTHTAYVIDFGYLSASMGKTMMDDYVGLSRIIKDALEAIDFHDLCGDEKKYYSVLKGPFNKYLLETNTTAGDFARNPLELLKQLDLLKDQLGCENKQNQQKNISDFLAAELMGERYEEWKELFVPDFLASSLVLAKNPSVITGLRGCGKTTIFRRLSALFNCHLGPIQLEGADKFWGCYQNARNLAEAFPWLPPEKIAEAKNQIIRYFHIGWSLDIIAWLDSENKKHERGICFDWLYDFFSREFGEKVIYTSSESVLELRSQLISKQNESRLADKYYPEGNIALSEISFLDDLVSTIKNNCPWTEDKPFYFFFDDYSTPLITEPIQKILNAIIFRRSPNVIFKVATESVESFVPVGLNDKKLEENDDYVLIDFGSIHLLNSDADNSKIIAAILNKRIKRDARLRDKSIELKDLLGASPKFVELASSLRADPDSNKKILYYGYDFLCAMWSCDIREIIRLFASMIELTDSQIISGDTPQIPREVQDKAMREAGGKYISLLGAATHPELNIYQMNSHAEPYKSYGDHLKLIAECFHRLAAEALKKDIKNEANFVPKQARRIEITESCSNLPEEAANFYRGIIRYGLFIRDTRGKSVRGSIVPRLFLRGLLIPYFKLSFSKRDSIFMDRNEFIRFLCDPQSFKKNNSEDDAKSKSGGGDIVQHDLFTTSPEV